MLNINDIAMYLHESQQHWGALADTYRSAELIFAEITGEHTALDALECWLQSSNQIDYHHAAQ